MVVVWDCIQCSEVLDLSLSFGWPPLDLRSLLAEFSFPLFRVKGLLTVVLFRCRKFYILLVELLDNDYLSIPYKILIFSFALLSSKALWFSLRLVLGSGLCLNRRMLITTYWFGAYIVI